MSPGGIGFFAAILRHLQTNGFVGAEPSLPESFGFAPGTENKDPVCQMIRNGTLRTDEPVFPAVEVDQQNHEPIWITIHPDDVI